jgi:uncharacterized membrane protein
MNETAEPHNSEKVASCFPVMWVISFINNNTRKPIPPNVENSINEPNNNWKTYILLYREDPERELELSVVPVEVSRLFVNGVPNPDEDDGRCLV